MLFQRKSHRTRLAVFPQYCTFVISIPFGIRTIRCNKASSKCHCQAQETLRVNGKPWWSIQEPVTSTPSIYYTYLSQKGSDILLTILITFAWRFVFSGLGGRGWGWLAFLLVDRTRYRTRSRSVQGCLQKFPKNRSFSWDGWQGYYFQDVLLHNIDPKTRYWPMRIPA